MPIDQCQLHHRTPCSHPREAQHCTECQQLVLICPQCTGIVSQALPPREERKPRKHKHKSKARDKVKTRPTSNRPSRKETKKHRHYDSSSTSSDEEPRTEEHPDIRLKRNQNNENEPIQRPLPLVLPVKVTSPSELNRPSSGYLQVVNTLTQVLYIDDRISFQRIVLNSGHFDVYDNQDILIKTAGVYKVEYQITLATVKSNNRDNEGRVTIGLTLDKSLVTGSFFTGWTGNTISGTCLITVPSPSILHFHIVSMNLPSVETYTLNEEINNVSLTLIQLH